MEKKTIIHQSDYCWPQPAWEDRVHPALTSAMRITIQVIFFASNAVYMDCSLHFHKPVMLFHLQNLKCHWIKWGFCIAWKVKEVSFLCQYLPSCSLAYLCASPSSLPSSHQPTHFSSLQGHFPAHPDSKFSYTVWLCLGWSHSTKHQVLQLCVSSARNACIFQELSWQRN